MSVEVWASDSGQDCTLQSSRVGASRVCWLISRGNIPLVLAGSMRLKVRDIIAQSRSIDAGEAYVNAGADVCGTVDRRSFSVAVMLLRGPHVLAGQRLLVEADTIGPPALSSVNVTPLDRSVSVRWTTNREVEASEAPIVSIFYGPGTVQTDATSARKCNAEGFTVRRDGSVTVDEGKLSRQDLKAEYANALISGLTNGATYAVAVGASDAFLNEGDVSVPECVTPEVLDAEANTAVQAGGGGGCAQQGSDTPTGSFTLVAGVIAIAGIMARKRPWSAPSKLAQRR
jgi:hypothetical protein